MVNKVVPRVAFQNGKVIDLYNNQVLVDNKKDENGTLLPIHEFKKNNIPIGQNLMNALRAELTNDVGGYQIPIDTLTQIAREITTQTFYGSDKKITDYVPVVVGQGAFSQSLLTFKTGSTSNQFKQNIFRSGQNSTLTQANTQIEAVTLPILNFAQGMTYSMFEMKQAALFGNFDVIAAKEESRKVAYDQGILQVAFVGLPEDGIYGFVNQPTSTIQYAVAPDEGTTIPVPISTMTADQINNLVINLIQTYYKNTGYTRFPDSFTIPTFDYLGLPAYINPEFPLENSSRMKILDEAFKKQTGNPNFKIKHTIYCQPSQANAIGATLTSNRYILSVDDPRSLKMLLPVPYTVTLANTVDGFSWQNAAYGQFSGVQLLKPAETQYFDTPGYSN